MQRVFSLCSCTRVEGHLFWIRRRKRIFHVNDRWEDKEISRPYVNAYCMYHICVWTQEPRAKEINQSETSLRPKDPITAVPTDRIRFAKSLHTHAHPSRPVKRHRFTTIIWWDRDSCTAAAPSRIPLSSPSAAVLAIVVHTTRVSIMPASISQPMANALRQRSHSRYGRARWGSSRARRSAERKT